MIGRDHAKSGREGLGGDRGKRLELGGKDEEVGCMVVARELPVVDETGKRDRARETETRDATLEVLPRLALARDEEPRLRVSAKDLWHRLNEKRLAGERVKALHVQESRAVPDAESPPGFPLRAGSRRLEALVDRGIYDHGLPRHDAELEGALQKEAAVVGHGRGALVHPKEGIESALSVVPDLGSVVRENEGEPAPLRQKGRCLVHEGVAVDVHHVGALEEGTRLAPYGKAGLDRREPKRPGEAVSGSADVAYVRLPQSPFAGLEGEKAYLVSLAGEPIAQKLRKERVRRLVRRQVRRHHADDQCQFSRNSRNVEPKTPFSTTNTTSHSKSR